MKLIVMAAVAAAGLGLAAPALAQDATSTSPYRGLYGNLGFNDDQAQGSNTEGVVGRVGDRLNKYFGVEGEFNVGVHGGGREFGAPGAQTHVDVKQQYGGAGYVVGFLPVMPNVDILARVGYGASQYKINPATAPGYDANENGPALRRGRPDVRRRRQWRPHRLHPRAPERAARPGRLLLRRRQRQRLERGLHPQVLAPSPRPRERGRGSPSRAASAG
ncbi:MAG: outer membrane beta-barrel protein [Caulobacteraceae bacterium]